MLESMRQIVEVKSTALTFLIGRFIRSLTLRRNGWWSGTVDGDPTEVFCFYSDFQCIQHLAQQLPDIYRVTWSC